MSQTNKVRGEGRESTWDCVSMNTLFISNTEKNSHVTYSNGNSPSLVQELLEEVDRTPLRALQPILLLRIVGIASRRKAVCQAGEINVLPLYTCLGQQVKRSLLQFGRVHFIVFRAQDLHGHFYVFDLRLLEQRRVCSRDGVDERRVGSELEGGPGAVAEANGCYPFVLRLERLRVLFDLGPADILVVPADEGHNVKVLADFRVGERVGVYYFAVETAQKTMVR
jgi:hypothetical protein